MNVRINIPVPLKRIKFLEIGSVENYIDEHQTELSIENVKRKLLPLLDAVEVLHANNPKFKINLILGEFFLRLLSTEISSLDYVISILNKLKQSGIIQIALEGNPEYYPNLCKQIIVSQMERFKGLFGEEPKSYVCSSNTITAELEGLIYECGFTQVISISSRKKSSSGDLRLTLMGKRAINHLVSKYGVRTTLEMAFDGDGKAGVVLNFQDVFGLVDSHPDIISLMYGGSFSYVGIDDRNINEPRVTHKGEFKQQSLLGEKNEMQEAVWGSLVSMINVENVMDDDSFIDYYSLLCQKELFCFMNTHVSANYTYKNPYDSPYSTYINMMNILKDLEMKIGQSIN